MQLYLIRHAMTQGNLEHRYIGRSDEPIVYADLHKAEQLRLHLPENPDEIYCSTYQRTKMTAALFYPDRRVVPVHDFRECDFGIFEGKTYQELAADPAYMAWIEQGGLGDFPEGESVSGFRRRCSDAFAHRMACYDDSACLCFFLHGGTIMSILSAYTNEPYFSFQCENLSGYRIHAGFSDQGKLMFNRISQLPSERSDSACRDRVH